MKRTVILFLILCLSTTLPAQDTTIKLLITPLINNFYVYTSYGDYENSKVPAHGLYVLTKEGAIILDSPWDTTQFQPLLDSIRIKHNSKAVFCIATHFHDDRSAGLAYYRSKGIATYTTFKTDSLAALRNKKRAEFLLQGDSSFNIGGQSFQVYYPGEGHTPDNIVVWFPQERVLYGGCLIKGVEDETLGYLGDANKAAYAATIKNLMRRCRHPRFVITGHAGWADTRALKHTLRLARKLRKKQ